MAWKVHHKLETVEITFRLAPEDSEGGATITARGYSPTKRTALWVYQEAFDPDVDACKGYEASDAVNHIVLVCQQDRPNTKERLNFALSGGVSWDQTELF